MSEGKGRVCVVQAGGRISEEWGEIGKFKIVRSS